VTSREVVEAQGTGRRRAARAGLQGLGRGALPAQPRPTGCVGRAARRRPAACGWADQFWTLPRIAEVVRTRFGVDYTLPGLDLLLHRRGWTVQLPARRATERDEEQITAWREETWSMRKGQLTPA